MLLLKAYLRMLVGILGLINDFFIYNVLGRDQSNSYLCSFYRHGSAPTYTFMHSAFRSMFSRS